MKPRHTGVIDVSTTMFVEPSDMFGPTKGGKIPNVIM